MNKMILLAVVFLLGCCAACFAQAPDGSAFVAVGRPQSVEEWAAEKLADRMKRMNMAEWAKKEYVSTAVPLAASAFAVVQEASADARVPLPEQRPSSAPPALPSRHSHEQGPVQKGHYSQLQTYYQLQYTAPPPRRGWFGRLRGARPLRSLLGLGGC